MSTTMATGNRTLSLVEVPQHPTMGGGFASSWIDLYGEAMDEALGVEKTSLSAMVEFNAHAVDACELLAGDFAGTVCNALATCMKAQLSWFNLMSEASRVLMAVAVPVGAFAFAKDGSTPASAEVLDHGSMDLVLGEECGSPLPDTEVSLVEAGGSGGPVQADVAETPQQGMDLVIGGTAA